MILLALVVPKMRENRSQYILQEGKKMLLSNSLTLVSRDSSLRAFLPLSRRLVKNVLVSRPLTKLPQTPNM